jgi:hypothetical protein
MSNIILHHIPILHLYCCENLKLHKSSFTQSSAWKGLTDNLPFATIYQASVRINMVDEYQTVNLNRIFLKIRHVILTGIAGYVYVKTA